MRSGGTFRHPPGEIRSHEPGLVHELLAYAATRQSRQPFDSGFVASWNRADERQIQQVIDAGLAPLLYRASREGRVQIPPAWRETLQSADLTAQVRHGNVIDAANEIIDVCNDMRVTVMLLKGISISDQHYPVAHERPMGDIDILVPEANRESVEAALVRRGYRRSDFEMGEGSHHGVPLLHHERQVWVEVHTALFPTGDTLQNNHLFSRSQIAAQSVASTFQGRPIRRLTNELQLVYIASYWIRDLTENKIHPSFLPPLFDAIYLLKASRQTLDWDGLLGWLDNEMATASLYVMLAYVCRFGLDESASRIVPRLAAGQDIVGPAELDIVLGMLDSYLIGNKPPPRLFGDWHATILLRIIGTLLTPGSHAAKLFWIPWNIVFPPLVQARYSLSFQWERISRLLSGKGSDASKE